MKSFRLPILFLFVTFVLIFLNLLALMRIFPLIITIPLLFLSIYLTLYSLASRRTYKHFRQRY